MIRKLLIAIMLMCGAALAQTPQAGPGPGGSGSDVPHRNAGMRMGMGAGMHRKCDGQRKFGEHCRFDGQRRFGMRPGWRRHPLMFRGRWWKNAEVAKAIGLDDAQVQKIEQIFQDSRLKLVDIHASLQKEEIKLEPLIDADNPDENAVLGAIDRIAADRTELVKANARMAFAIRRVLTLEQWKKLRALRSYRDSFPPPMGGPGDGFRQDGPHHPNAGPDPGSDLAPGDM